MKTRRRRTFEDIREETRDRIARQLVENRGRYLHYVRGVTEADGKHVLYRVILRSVGRNQTVLIFPGRRGRHVKHEKPELLF